jgi:glucose-6-phosphate isomerase
MVAFGPADQHSLLQQVMEGAKDKFVVFVRNLAIETGAPLLTVTFPSNQIMTGKSMGQLLAAEAAGTQQALDEMKISNLRLSLQKNSERELGFLFMHFMLVVGALSEALNIDGFNQPGVELGKRLAQGLLRS